MNALIHKSKFDLTVGPFILFEYCSKGQLNDHVSTLRSKVTVQVHEQLLRFCLQVARGMGFLAAKKVYHCIVQTIVKHVIKIGLFAISGL